MLGEQFDDQPVWSILPTMKWKQGALVIWVVVILTGCDIFNNSSVEEPGEITPTPTQPSASIANSTPAIQSVITSTNLLENNLTLWLPPEIAQHTESGTAVLSDQLLAYASTHPEIDLMVEQKPVGGPGGILSYLRTGRSVAPAILPDLIAIPTDQLAAAATENLIFPLDDLIHPTMLEDLYPAAQALAHPQDQTLGYPFVITSLSHLAYNQNLVEIPSAGTWAELISSEGSFVFPASGDAGALLALQFYLAAGGTLADESGQITLETQPLVTALEQLSRGRNNGFILLQSSNLSSSEAAWQEFEGGAVTWVQTTSEIYLQNRSPDFSPGFTAVPGPDEALVPLVNGWAWAITTPDPTHRARAAELLAALVSATNLGEWSFESYFLPATRLAMSHWPENDAYIAFLQQELERAGPYPTSPTGSIMTAVGNAVFDIISLTQSPQNAAQLAVNALQTP